MKFNAINRYCRRVGRELLCLLETKKELLAGLKEELDALPPEDTSSVRKLEARYGKTITVAVELQEAVSAKERSIALFRERRTFRRWMTVTVVLIVLLILFCIFLLKVMPFVSITYPPVTT